jgi:hypothetical protein
MLGGPFTDRPMEPLSTMWSTIDRARRRLDRAAARTNAPRPETTAVQETAAPAPEPPLVLGDVVIVFGQAEIDSLGTALQHLLGQTVERPDSPARLEDALSLLLAGRRAPGRIRVLRRPAAVSTPEAWEIHLDGVEHATGTAVRSAGRTGRFPA